jgi:hypothetical protein
LNGHERNLWITQIAAVAAARTALRTFLVDCAVYNRRRPKGTNVYVRNVLSWAGGSYAHLLKVTAVVEDREVPP